MSHVHFEMLAMVPFSHGPARTALALWTGDDGHGWKGKKRNKKQSQMSKFKFSIVDFYLEHIRLNLERKGAKMTAQRDIPWVILFHTIISGWFNVFGLMKTNFLARMCSVCLRDNVYSFKLNCRHFPYLKLFHVFIVIVFIHVSLCIDLVVWIKTTLD